MVTNARKDPCRFVVTSNVSNLGSFTVATSEGSCVQGNRVLLTGQTAASQNGIYNVGVVSAGSAPLTRASDLGTSGDCFAGSKVFVSEGTIWANTDWTLTTQGTITLDTTALTFSPDRALTVAALRLSRGKVDGELVRLVAYSTLADRGGGRILLGCDLG